MAVQGFAAASSGFMNGKRVLDGQNKKLSGWSIFCLWSPHEYQTHALDIIIEYCVYLNL